MARHADRGAGGRPARSRPQLRVSLPLVAACVLVIGAVVLGVWWWNLRSVSDPISADPVDAYAVVVSSPTCPGGDTTVRISGLRPAVTATLSGCGYATDQRLAVQYLKGHPQQVRLAGTTLAGGSGLSGKLLPIGILTAGVIAVLAALALLVDRRRSRHLASENAVSVADLRSRGATPASPTPNASGAAGDGAPRPGGDDPPPADSGAGLTEPELERMDPGEPSHLLPGGFVIVDEQLFTHSGTEAAPRPDPSVPPQA